MPALVAPNTAPAPGTGGTTTATGVPAPGSLHRSAPMAIPIKKPHGTHGHPHGRPHPHHQHAHHQHAGSPIGSPGSGFGSLVRAAQMLFDHWQHPTPHGAIAGPFSSSAPHNNASKLHHPRHPTTTAGGSNHASHARSSGGNKKPAPPANGGGANNRKEGAPPRRPRSKSDPTHA